MENKESQNTINGEVKPKPLSDIESSEKKSRKRRQKKKKSGLGLTPDAKNNHADSPSNGNKTSSVKRKQLEGETPNKKQKMEHQKRAEKHLPTYKVVFPPGISCYKKPLMEVLKSCDSVQNPIKLTVSFASKKQEEQNLTKLQKVSVGEKQLIVQKITTSSNTGSPKRVIRLSQSFKDIDKLKAFYEAEDVEQKISPKGNPSNIFVLTFESENKAIAASKKTFNFGNKQVELINSSANTKLGDKKEAKDDDTKQEKEKKKRKRMRPNNRDQKKDDEEEEGKEKDEDELINNDENKKKTKKISFA